MTKEKLTDRVSIDSLKFSSSFLSVPTDGVGESCPLPDGIMALYNLQQKTPRLWKDLFYVLLLLLLLYFIFQSPISYEPNCWSRAVTMGIGRCRTFKWCRLGVAVCHMFWTETDSRWCWIFFMRACK